MWAQTVFGWDNLCKLLVSVAWVWISVIGEWTVLNLGSYGCCCILQVSISGRASLTSATNTRGGKSVLSEIITGSATFYFFTRTDDIKKRCLVISKHRYY